MSPKLLAHFALFAVALIYGLNYSIAKDVMPAFIEPRGFILLRAIGATALFWLTALSFGNEKIALKHHWRLAVCGVFGVAANQMLFFEGLNITSPINAAVMMTTNPILVLIMSAIILKESLRWSRIVGIALGIAGALFLITRGGQVVDIFDADKSLGNLLVFLNAASYAAYLVLVKPLMANYKAITVIKWVFLYGLILVFPFGASQLMDVTWHAFPPDIIWKVAFVVIGTTYLAYLFNVYALKTVTSTTVSFYIYLQPLIAAIAAIAMGRDQLTSVLLLSAGLIFSGVFLVSFYKR
ncbi:DMT family transporter [Owenweeksia hongkongensis]|uniref:DMT family transporter n=1 Tax=Owenweeksia hongkongensis TaxID=253245 RepID=UPI003A9385BA